MRVLLINPPFNRLMGLEQDYIHIGLGYLAGYLDKFTDCYAKVYNAEIGDGLSFKNNTERLNLYANFLQLLESENKVWDEIKTVIQKEDPDVIGINLIAVKLRAALRIRDIAKELNPNVKIVVGGQYASTFANNLKNKCTFDFIVKGEGEKALAHLIKNIHTSPKIIKKGRVETLDELPFPARDLMFPRHSPNGYAHMITSRGCPYNCIFCDSKSVWGNNIRYRTVGNVIDEMKLVKNRYNPTEFTIWDEVFTYNGKRTIDFCKQFRASGIDATWKCDTRVDLLDEKLIIAMKKANCGGITVGVESGSNTVLEYIKKGFTINRIRQTARLLNKHQMKWKANFIMGLPNETEEDIKNSVRLMQELKPTRVTLSIATPYGGTQLFEDLLADNIINENFNPAFYSHQSNLNYFNKFIPATKYSGLMDKFSKKVDEYNDERGGFKVWVER